MSSSNTYYIEILNNIIVYLYRCGNPMIYIFGNVGNLLSISVFFKKSWSKNVCVFYFKILLLFGSIYLNSVIVGSTLINGYNINLRNSNVVLCKLYYYIVYLLFSLSPTVLILASIDRLLISSQNVDTRLYSSKRLAYFSISISTFFWVVFNFHILIKINIQQFSPSNFVCYYDLSKSYINFVSYFLVVSNCLFCFLMIILSLIAFKNVRRIRIISSQQRNQIRSMTKKDFQMIRCLFVQDIVYILLSVCSNLYAVYGLLTRDQARTDLEQAINSFLTSFFNFIYFWFYCSSFFIFLTVSKAFRNEMKRMIYKMLGKDLMAIRREEHNQEQPINNNIELNVVVVNTIVISN